MVCHPLHKPLVTLSTIKTYMTYKNSTEGLEGIRPREGGYATGGPCYNVSSTHLLDLSPWQHFGHILVATWTPCLPTPSRLSCGGTNPTPPPGSAPDSHSQVRLLGFITQKRLQLQLCTLRSCPNGSFPHRPTLTHPLMLGGDEC